MSMEDQPGAADVHTMDPQAAGDGDGGRCKYSRDEMLAIYWGMGDSYYTGVTEVWAVLEPLSQELYEMDVDHGAQKARHKTIDRRQRGKKAKEVTSTEVEENSYEDLLLELGLDVPNQSQSSVSESEAYEDDSEEEVESFQPLAFHVEGEPDFESGEPQDGWEYLRRVKSVSLPRVDLCKFICLIVLVAL
jgi:survival of motor neuron protein-interacting protein 1